MAEIQVFEERPIALAEAKEAIEKIEKRDKELSERTKKTLEYINKVNKKKLADVGALRKKLEGLSIARLRPRHVAKIIDINPKDIDSLRTLLTAENLTLKQEDLNKVLECVK